MTPSATSSRRSGSVTQEIKTTIVAVSGSSTHTSIQTSSRVIAAESASATSSETPGLNGSGGTSGNSGLSSSSKKVVGGVVGGVGGAILLGGLAIVAWRIWGRNRQTNYGEDDPMNPAPSSSGQEKSSSDRGHSPFRSTLDQYHNPAQPVNTASNF